ncbi:MAG: RluA family pseudouridine synthase [Treponema sp.]|nr:RluA family pseudouridine synthase [Treponema sp.]
MKDTLIIYENSEILIVYKEAGVSVQGGQGIKYPLDEELSKQLGYKIYLVHRLDKETSGLLAVAKNPAAACKWTKLIATKKVTKNYLAVCFGNPLVNGKESLSGVLSDSIKKDGRNLEASTHFKVLSSRTVELPVPATDAAAPDADGPKSLKLSALSLTLDTGRMHQIRIHLGKANAPIAGDDKHGNFKFNKLARKLGIKKLCLMAYELTINDAGKKMTFRSPVPEHMKGALSLCGLQEGQFGK